MYPSYDVIIVGGSFSGLTLAHHLPKDLRVLVIDVKPSFGSTVESTGLITEHTRQEFASFFDIDAYITKKIHSFCVVAPGYRDYFISRTKTPWLYQTDTRELIAALARTAPENVTVSPATAFKSARMDENGVTQVTIAERGQTRDVQTRFLVGADGGHSPVARAVPELAHNEQFLFGYEEVHTGRILLGPHPQETAYHFWFGAFCLGYGGWLSPTTVDGCDGYRIGLAKMHNDPANAKALMQEFLAELNTRGMIATENPDDKPAYIFGSFIPVNAPRNKIAHKNTLLIGDAAGFCGAFVADGIKGSVVSAKVAAPLIARFLNGEHIDLQKELHAGMNDHNRLMAYYYRHARYRHLWNYMKRDRTFAALFHLLSREQDSFLQQFTDDKDKHRGLTRTVLRVKYLPQLVTFGAFLFCDMLFPLRKNAAKPQ